MRHHYRAEKLALWLNLIPKIDRDDGSERGSHQLDNSDNSSTFDDYQKLLSSNLENTIFPSPPPMPPVRPTPSDRGGSPAGGWTTQGKGHRAGVTDQDGSVAGGRPGGGRRDQPGGDNSQSSKYSEGSGTADATSDVNGSGGHDATLEPEPEDGKTAGSGKTSSSGVPLSMVVAIGGSLLLINLLIFAGLCYQRERIRKMRRFEKPVLPPPEADYDEEDRGAGAGLMPVNHHNSNKMLAGVGPASANGSPSTGARRTAASVTSAGGGPECMSLISTGGSSSGGGHQHPHSGASPHRSNGYHGNTHIHNPSPQPFSDDVKELGSGSGRPSPRGLPYMSRRTPPPLASIESSGSSAVGNSSGGGGGGGGGGGKSFVPVTSGGYSTVPTHASSPVHRTRPSVSPPSYTEDMRSMGAGGGARTSTSSGVGGVGLSGTGTYVNSQIRPAQISDIIVNHKPADIHSRVVPPSGGSHPSGSGVRTGPPMTTFGVGAGSGFVNQGRPGLGSGFSDRTAPDPVAGSSSDPSSGTASSSSGAASGSSSDPVYKKINKSGQNNAVTIV